MKKVVPLILLASISFSSLAKTDEECKAQAVAATSAITNIATGEIPSSAEMQEKAKQRLVEIEKNLSQGKYCKALQLAVSQS
ncbi:hypothetical protein RJ45_04070 [Photobacterium gaetbulicola]|uniref:Uncharacterized protein n=1 Tax=Photobacterium gaetbulicola TaxID=1295392 RepID=A0A0B9G855_9GAMM|nr:hypothetical protein [Photobacterium gaetbulicola]KHT64883.1 hypothetical protein RJ45_04070 [Photobacterium gaetbulicola]